jgi:hypothetical protein
MRTIEIPIEKMSLSQKMDVIQRVWDSMVQKDAPAISPAWHRDVLMQRRASIKSGEKKMLPLAEFKKRLRVCLLNKPAHR